MNIDKYVLVKPIGKGEIGEVFLVLDIIDSFTNLYDAQVGGLTQNQRNKMAERSIRLIQGTGGRDFLNKLEAQVLLAYKDENKKSSLKEYAFKKLDKEHADNTETARRFRLEYQIMAKCGSPNILRVYDYGTDSEDQRPFYTMEYFEERYSFEEIINFPLYWKVEYVKQALWGLDELHKKNIVCKYLTPHNIFSAKAGDGIIAKVADLGIVKEGRNSEIILKRSGIITETPCFIAPEHFNGTSIIEMQCDIFSMGVTLYYLLTGKLPYDIKTKDLSQILDYYAQVEKGACKPVPVGDIKPEVPPELEDITMRAIAYLPSKRVFCRDMSAESFAQELASIQANLV